VVAVPGDTTVVLALVGLGRLHAGLQQQARKEATNSARNAWLAREKKVGSVSVKLCLSSHMQAVRVATARQANPKIRSKA
jgi:hypothetical protein